jgi:uncharacterized repeat protein (TIGR01451 family)
MKILKQLYCWIACLLPVVLPAQSLRWQQRYKEGVNPSWVFGCKTPDGYQIRGLGFDTTGGVQLYGFTLKVTKNGRLLYRNRIEDWYWGMASTQDSGLVAITIHRTAPDSAKIRKVDKNGQLQWSRVLTNIYLPQAVIETTDSNYIVFGINNGGSAQFVRKFDRQGNLLWAQYWAVAGSWSTGVTRMMALPSGGFLITDGEAFLTKADALGNVLWTQRNRSNTMRVTGMTERDGKVTYLDTDGCFYQLDSLGNFLRSRCLGITSAIHYSLLPRQAGGYWVQYGLMENGAEIQRIVLVDADFNIIRDRQFNVLPNNFMTMQLVAESNNNLFCVGNETSDIVMMLLDTIKGAPSIHGYLTSNCSSNLQNWLVGATRSDGLTFYDVTDSLNHYAIQTDTGQFTVRAYPPSSFWQSNSAISNQTIIGQRDSIPLAINCLTNCSRLTVDLSAAILRRCFPTEYIVNYNNAGTQTASQVYIEVKLDSLLQFVGSTVPPTRQTGQLLRFDIGTLRPNESQRFGITVRSACGDSTRLGQALCSQVRIYPDSICAPPANWSGANLQVTGVCESDSVHFTVSNLGRATSSAVRQIVMEDSLIVSNRLITVAANSQQHFRYGARGNNWRMSVAQEPFHPYANLPIAVVEGCNWLPTTRPKTSLTTTLPLDTRNPVFRTFCNTLQGAYDPNDKMSFPAGYGVRRLIEPNQDLEYMIRFQNTGTDTAFTVVIQDTLSKLLDVNSLQPLSASHPYRWTILKGNVVEFTFSDILLVDSFHNEPRSHGFVKFHIKQQPNVPLGSTLYNDASIFFDFNAPVITNRTWLTVGKQFILSSILDEASKGQMRIVSVPNPTMDRATLEILEDDNRFSTRNFQLFDVTGHLLREADFNGNRYELERNGLNAGLYFFRVTQNGKILGTGRIMIQ